jgi:hypothetical protein
MGDAAHASARGRWLSATLIGLLLAGCGSSVPGDPNPRRSTPAAASPATSGAPVGSPAVPSTPSPSDPVTGSFRRGGVPVPPDVLAAATDECRSVPTPPYAEDIGSRPVAVSDLRGEGVLILVFASATTATGCRVTLDNDALSATLFAVEPGPDAPLDVGEITLAAYELDGDGSRERTIAVGRYGDRVVKVRAGFDDDTYVTSSMANGWYAMWWLGRVRPAVIVAADNRNLAMGKLTPPTGPPAP